MIGQKIEARITEIEMKKIAEKQDIEITKIIEIINNIEITEIIEIKITETEETMEMIIEEMDEEDKKMNMRNEDQEETNSIETTNETIILDTTIKKERILFMRRGKIIKTDKNIMKVAMMTESSIEKEIKNKEKIKKSNPDMKEK